jgi:hypothetical protein
MDIQIVETDGVKVNYQFRFNHNLSAGITSVSMFRDGKFLHSETAECSIQDSKCRDCGRKKALAKLFKKTYFPGTETLPKVIRSRAKKFMEPIVPRHHRYFIYDAYRNLTSTPRWEESSLKIKDYGVWNKASLEALIQTGFFQSYRTGVRSGVLDTCVQKAISVIAPPVVDTPAPTVRKVAPRKVAKKVATKIAAKKATKKTTKSAVKKTARKLVKA